MICAMIRNKIGDRLRPITKSWISWSPPRTEKTDENSQEPTNIQHTMAEVRTVR